MSPAQNTEKKKPKTLEYKIKEIYGQDGLKKDCWILLIY